MPQGLLHTDAPTLRYLNRQYPRPSDGYTCVKKSTNKFSLHIPNYGGPERNFAELDTATVLPFTLIQVGCLRFGSLGAFRIATYIIPQINELAAQMRSAFWADSAWC